MLYSIEEYLKDGEDPATAINWTMEDDLADLDIDPDDYAPFTIAVWEPKICEGGPSDRALWTNRANLEAKLKCGGRKDIILPFEQAFQEMESQFRAIEPNDRELRFG